MYSGRETFKGLEPLSEVVGLTKSATGRREIGHRTALLPFCNGLQIDPIAWPSGCLDLLDGLPLSLWRSREEPVP